MFTLRSLIVQKWRQFEDIHFVFHEQLTILTGSNGAGKTTLLNFLYGETTSLRTYQEFGSGKFQYTTNNWDKEQNLIGTLELTGITINLSLKGRHNSGKPQNDALEQVYHHSIRHTEQQANLSRYPLMVLIESHRKPHQYTPFKVVSLEAWEREEAYRVYGPPDDLQEERYSAIKAGLMHLLFAASGAPGVGTDQNAQADLEVFQQLLKDLLPERIGFQRLTLRRYEIVAETDTGDFLLDAISGGMASVLEVAWSVFTAVASRMHPEFPKSQVVLLMDEPENHLHPELQRRLLPALLKAFPDMQMVVATHSPFIITSVKDSTVYALRFSDNNRVHSEKLDFRNKAVLAAEVLREVLGLSSTLPIWAEVQLESIIEKYQEQPITQESLGNLRAELTQAGLEDFAPDAIAEVFRKADDAETP